MLKNALSIKESNKLKPMWYVTADVHLYLLNLKMCL